MNIVFVTCDAHPEINQDDALVLPYLQSKNISCQVWPWSAMNVDWKQFDLVILRSCWDYYLRFDQFSIWLQELKRESVKILNDISTIEGNIDKTYLFELERKGFPIPETTLLKKGGEFNLKAILKTNKWDKAVIKPAVSAGAYNTWVVSQKTIEEDQQRLNQLIRENTFLIQKFQSQINDYGELSFVFFNGEYSHTVLKKAQGNDFRVQFKYGGTAEEISPSDEILLQAKKIVSDTLNNSILYARVDTLLIKGILVIMEIELIEPVLYLQYSKNAAMNFSKAIIKQLCKI